jgi:hypothetical protein
MTNKTKKSKNKVFFDFYSGRAGENMSGEKYLWQCTICQRWWLLRQDAQRCKHKNFLHYGEILIKHYGLGIDPTIGDKNDTEL